MAQELGAGLDLIERDREGGVRGEEGGEHLAGALVDLGPGAPDVVVSSLVAEQHPPALLVLVRIGEPPVEHRADQLVEGQARWEVRQERREVLAVAVEDGQVEALLGTEVAVEDRLRDTDVGGVSSSRVCSYPVAPNRFIAARRISSRRSAAGRRVFGGLCVVVTSE